MNRVVVDSVTAGYGAVSVLHDVSLEVRESELVALLGTNGNGKSTLLNCIMGLIRPTAGRITLELDGKAVDITGKAPHEIVELGIAYVPEGRRLAPNLTVRENLLLAGSGRRARAELQKNLDFCLEIFPILAERRDQKASTMSGGQQQMLAIARALMTAPRIMLVDEPSVGLAPVIVEQVIHTICALQERRAMTVLMAEQSFFQAIDVASRAYVLSHGAIVRSFAEDLKGLSADDIRLAMLGMAPQAA